jgi:hypothetical protein
MISIGEAAHQVTWQWLDVGLVWRTRGLGRVGWLGHYNLQLVVGGLSHTESAAQLTVSTGTVKTHINHFF